jgi:K+-sensing histidine kinase KdpD
MKRSHKIWLAVLGIAVVGMAAVAIMSLVDMQKKAAKLAKEDASINSMIAEFNSKLVVGKTISTLSGTEKAQFNQDKSLEIDIYPLSMNPSPKMMTTACMESNAHKLGTITSAYQGAAARNKGKLAEAVVKYRDYCYKTYSATGSMPAEDMPNSMQH